MNETMIDLDLDGYVEAVRRALADLPDDVRDDLTDDLAADLGELVAERGPSALLHPDEYAAELRAAAGHAPASRRRPRWWIVRDAAMEAVDGAHNHWDRLVDSLPGDTRGFLSALQPAWWVLRAGIAWLVAQDVRGPYIVIDGLWLAVLVALIVASVELGRGSWRLGALRRSSMLARLLLISLNVVALCLLPGAVDRLSWHIAEARAWQFDHAESVPADEPDVITYQGGQVCVLQVFDARGRLVRGGYVWDATGQRRLPMNTEEC